MDNNCSKEKALESDDEQPINLSFLGSPSCAKASSPSFPLIQIDSVPIDDILSESVENLASKFKKSTRTNTVPSFGSDTVTSNPLIRRKCSESVFLNDEKESETCVDTPRSNLQEVNEVFVEITDNLCQRFPPPNPSCTDDGHLKEDQPHLQSCDRICDKIKDICIDLPFLECMEIQKVEQTMTSKEPNHAEDSTIIRELSYQQEELDLFKFNNYFSTPYIHQCTSVNLRTGEDIKNYCVRTDIYNRLYNYFREIFSRCKFKYRYDYSPAFIDLNYVQWIIMPSYRRKTITFNEFSDFSKEYNIMFSRQTCKMVISSVRLLNRQSCLSSSYSNGPVSGSEFKNLAEVCYCRCCRLVSIIQIILKENRSSFCAGELYIHCGSCLTKFQSSSRQAVSKYTICVCSGNGEASIEWNTQCKKFSNTRKYSTCIVPSEINQTSVPFRQAVCHQPLRALPFVVRNYPAFNKLLTKRYFSTLLQRFGKALFSFWLKCLVDSVQRLDDKKQLASFTMDWMQQATGSDAIVTDDQLTNALQHLLISVEKGIERLEWNGVSKSWSHSSISAEGSSSFPRCCHLRAHPIDTKDTSVQTSPEDETSPETETSAPETAITAELVKSEVNVVIEKFACIQNDSKSVSVVRKNYIPSSESIATQTSLEPASSRVSELEKPPSEMMFALPPVEAAHEEDPDDGYCEHILTQPATISQVDGDLLHSQVAVLPGCRDVKGRSVVIISSNDIKDGFQLSSCHLAQLLLYFHTIPKKEVSLKGFLILIDASKPTEDFWSALDETFCLLEANLSNAISEILILFEESKEISDTSTLFPTSRIQCEILSSREKLLSFISKDQLLTKYNGDYLYDHQEWISFRKFLEPFINGCRLSGRHLVSLLEELRGSRLPVSSTLTHQMIEQQKRNVTHTFHDEQLRHLEEEGDTILTELHSYRTKSPHNHDYRENLERTSVLYDELRKAMSKLARLADKRLNRLEECLQLKTFQEESSQVLSWLCRKGNASLERHQAIADSLGAIKQQEEEFEKFYFLAMRQIEKGNDLLEEVSTFSHEVSLPKIQEENSNEGVTEESGVQDLAISLRQHLGSFSERLEGTRERIEDTAKCYQLMDKSYEWALDAMRFVSNMGITSTESADSIMQQIRCLQDYCDNHLRVPEDTFIEMMDLANKLGNEKLFEQCKVVKLRCEETFELIKTRQFTLQKVKQQMEVDSLQGPCWEAEDASQTPRTMRSHSQPMNTWIPVGTSTPYPGFSSHQRRRSTGGPMGGTTSQRYGSPIGSYTAFPSSYYPSTKESQTYCQEREDRLLSNGLITEDLTAQGPVASISKTLLDMRGSHRSGHSSSSSSSSSTSSRDATSLFRRSIHNTASGNEIRSTKKFPRRCQMWQLRDEALEKVKAEVREQTALLRVERLPYSQNKNRSEILEPPGTEKISRKSFPHSRPDPTHGPVPVNTHLLTSIVQEDSTDLGSKEEISNNAEAKSKKTLMLIMKELIQTERDYVKSLEYIIENYIPELLREDIPQALRGQRNVVFGNIEKIYEFHFQYFLNELEHCESSPFTVGQCFLDFQQQFYLYALYNKNKPKSDALMSEYGNTFFRNKQLELQDKMDLASYLLKPVQRMGKYALLLKQLLKECPEREKEHKALKEAEEMVRFQLRHGNDLLAMDALKDCDVNVKEQGLLLRQDEFIVWQGRSRKCMRHVFLFEDLILFSKARRDPQRKGYEMYQYKHSIKTTDLGMTEQVSDSPTKFEIWFRKRKLNDTFLLQAPNPEVRAAWVSEIRGILFDQAVNNKKNRLAEMSSMGIGNKPCLDIKPSEDQISDRSISIHQLARAPRFRNSIAVSPYDVRNNRNSVISVTSSSSSGSSQSSFSFYGTLNLGFEPGDSPRQLHRSLTQQSQCSTESGFCTDASTTGDSPECEQPRHKRAERSDSLLSNDSLSTNVSPTEVPCITKLEQSLEENLTTSM